MTTLTVGQGQQFASISAAIAASHDGDVLNVQAGTYTNDFATITTKITLQGVGGMVKMVATKDIPGDKGILVTNTDVTVDHFEFSGAEGPSGNDAGIRYQGGALTITNSYFHDNQNGILANPVANGVITIRNSEFDHNGTGDGRTHNIYVNAISKLTITDSYFHDAVIGHEIKSRALETVITNNRIYDNSGTASYNIDLPNGGKATVTGNVIEQGANTDNPYIVSFGVEGNLHAGSALTMSNNTIVNDLANGKMLVSSGDAPASVTGSKVWNVTDPHMYSGDNVTVTGTTHLSARPGLDTSHPWADGAASPGGTTGLGGGGTDDTLIGGAGPDTISGGEGRNYLRGGDGNDQIQGGSGFDDAHGNVGDDTVNGGGGGDWVVGGKGADTLFGDDGDDIVYGNLENDTCVGGAGADLVRGGQADDVLDGGAGNDWLSGDRGGDTITGGLGADIFHTFGDAGVDRVLDFNLAAGDRVMLDAGTVYTTAQSGSDVVISMTGGGQMTLVGVSLASLTTGWIFLG
jgi:Ca2+-binding RTX toxin-like protein